MGFIKQKKSIENLIVKSEFVQENKNVINNISFNHILCRNNDYAYFGSSFYQR